MPTSTAEDKPKRQMSEEQLEKLAIAREKALAKKNELRQLRDAEKAMKEAQLNERYEKVKEFEATLKKTQSAPKKTETPAAPPSDPETSETSDVEEEIHIVKKPKRKPVRKQRIIEVSSSSEDEPDYAEQVRLHYKNKYKNKYTNATPAASLPTPENIISETAKDRLKKQVQDEVNALAYRDLFNC